MFRLRFPWHTIELDAPLPSLLRPRDRKYLTWCLEHPGPRLLSVLGFLTYRQARWILKEKTWQ